MVFVWGAEKMGAVRSVAAGAASEAKGDHAGVQSPRSSSLSPPSEPSPSQQPAAPDGPMAGRSTASPLEREVPLSQSGGCSGSSTSKGATIPGRLTRACSAKKLDTSTGEMPEATFQVCANSIAARQLYKGLMAHMLLTLSLTLSLTLK